MGQRLQAAIFLLCVWTVATGQGQTQTQSQPTTPADSGSQPGAMHHGTHAPVAGPLKIIFGDKSAVWTTGKLAALPHTTITVYNEHARADQTYSGVALMDLLKGLGVPDKPHGADLRLYLVAEGSDGYQVVYSAAEVNPDVHDGTVLVADAVGGKPIGDSGPLQLVAMGEKRPARWVRNLTSIRVMIAQ